MTHDLVQSLRIHGNMGDKWSMKLSHKAADRILVLESSVASRDAEIAELVAVIKEVRDGFDCDADSHRYGTTCRRCLAKEVLAKVRKP